MHAMAERALQARCRSISPTLLREPAVVEQHTRPGLGPRFPSESGAGPRRFEALLGLGEMTGIPLFKAASSVGAQRGALWKRRKPQGPSGCVPLRGPLCRNPWMAAESDSPLQMSAPSKVVLSSASITQSRDCQRLAKVAVLRGFMFRCRFAVKFEALLSVEPTAAWHCGWPPMAWEFQLASWSSSRRVSSSPAIKFSRSRCPTRQPARWAALRPRSAPRRFAVFGLPANTGRATTAKAQSLHRVSVKSPLEVLFR